MDKENMVGGYRYMNRAFSEASVDSSGAFSDCNSDRSGEFPLSAQFTHRLILSAAAADSCCSDDLLRALVADLESGSVDVQRRAAMELRLLAKHSTDNRLKIARAGAVRPLVALISSADPQLQEHGVTAILNLSLCDENKDAIAAAGAIKPLVRALKSAGSAAARENAACALLRLGQVEEHKIAIGRSGAIPALVGLLEAGSLRGKKDAATALYTLCGAKENKVRAVQAGVVRPLLELMAEPETGMVDKAAYVMNALVGLAEARAAVVEEGGIPVLVEIVEVGTQRQKEIAAAVLLQICEESVAYRGMVAWKCQPSSNKKQTIVGIFDFLMDANMRLSGKESGKFMMLRKGDCWTDRSVDASSIKDVRIEMVNEKVNTNVNIPAMKNIEVKGKQKLKGDRVKAVWDDKKHAVFIRICLDQMRAGNKPHKTLNKLGYMNLEKEFYRQTGFHYYKDQLKNHWDSMRRDWQAWNALRNEAGIGWDETRGTYSQTEEWWAEFVKKFPGGDKFAHRPLDNVDELDMLFGEGSGRTDAPQSPSSDATPSAGTRDSQSDPTPESHADAEELTCPIIGNQNSTPSRSPRIEEFGETISPRYLNSRAHAARPEKRPRLSDGMNWESCMKQVYDILVGGSRLLAPSAEDDPTSIPNVIALLNETHGIVRNSEEWLFAATKFRNESVRQLFYALGDPESRAAWIKREYKLAHGPG